MKKYQIVVDGTETFYLQERHFLKWKDVFWSANLRDVKDALKRFKAAEERDLVWAEGDKL